MTDITEEQLMREVEEVEKYLDLYVKIRKACDRWNFWLISMFVILVGQLGVTIYDATLPVFQSLYLPFFICYCLAFSGQWIPRREIKNAKIALKVLNEKRHNDYYKAVTGQERH